jgi:hypothetical protein
MASKNHGVINASVYRFLIQMAPRDFELALVLKKGGGNLEAMVVVKREEPQAIFHGKTIVCGETVPANCALPVREVTTDLNI